MSDTAHPRVLVLGGGPDAERDVSIKSSSAIAQGLRDSGRFAVDLQIIDTLSLDQLRALPADIIFPYLHGPWGEGGPLQDLLEADGRPFVGAGSRASRAAMDKIATKAAALDIGIPSPPVWILNTRDPVCPTTLPVIIKPVHEGSTVGLHVCSSHAQFRAAAEAIQAEHAAAISAGKPVRTYMIEPKVQGPGGRPARELTVGILDGSALPLIEIRPKDGLYDYEAKYTRNDTQYLVGDQIPNLPDALAKKIAKHTTRLFKALGLRHIARADFMLDADNTPWLLEINTTPGFTDHSLVPKAAAHAGIPMPDLCARLADMALRDAPRPRA